MPCVELITLVIANIARTLEAPGKAAIITNELFITRIGFRTNLNLYGLSVKVLLFILKIAPSFVSHFLLTQLPKKFAPKSHKISSDFTPKM